MPNFAYIDGRYIPRHLGSISMEDRAANFGDAIYEVWVVVNGQLVDERRHLDRLERSLAALHIPMPMARQALTSHIYRLLRRNVIKFGTVYLQISRGVARRDHVPPQNIKPSVMIFTTAKPALANARQNTPKISVKTGPDLRWGRCDIKSTALLPNVLLRMEASSEGFQEAWMIDDQGYVTEGTSSSSWIVTREGELCTRQLSSEILPGVTRETVKELAKNAGCRFVERAFTIQEAYDAAEAFITSATSFVTPVTKIDQNSIGNGEVGPVTSQLRDLYLSASGL